MARVEIKEEINDTIEYIKYICKTQQYCDKCMFSRYDGFSYYCIFDSEMPSGWEKL